MRTFCTRLIQGSAIDAIAVATEVLNALPNKFTTFYCLHSFQGIRSVRGFIYDSKLHGEFFIEALTVATEVLNALPNKFTTFYCLHSFQGIRSVRGFIYDSKLHGEFFIEALSGESHRVFLSNGTMKEIK